jgi:hypothetical protein
MLIAYATAEGELASVIGTGAGQYAKILAEEIVKPGIEAVVMCAAKLCLAVKTSLWRSAS